MKQKSVLSVDKDSLNKKSSTTATNSTRKYKSQTSNLSKFVNLFNDLHFTPKFISLFN